MHLIVKERILLHLLEFSKYSEALEVPPGMTQEDIARASSIDLPHFTQYVRPLVREGLVRERTAHVRGIRRRRKVYDLTDSGKMIAFRLRDKLKSEVVRVRDEKGMRAARIADVLDDLGGKVSLLDIARQFGEAGTVDLAGLRSQPVESFVEMLSGAPRVERFVGRVSELEAVTGEGEGPRLFVVRGVAGIGKSCFGAQACELLRGKRSLFWHRVRPWDTRQSILASLGDFLSALGKPGLRSVLGRGEASRAAEVLREDLPGTQSFLVFDDAHEATPEAGQCFRVLKEAIADAADVRALILTRQTLPFYDRRDVTISGLVREIDLIGLEGKDVAALVPAERNVAMFAKLGRQLGGHPLFLELVRTHPTVSPKALRDVRRFVEEEIYTKLSDSEQRMMKMISLYRVPVPREALFHDPSLSHTVLLSLTDRSLIRPVGEENFEVHDTIRDFFSTVLTPSERNEFSAFAVGRLRDFASEALESGNLVLGVNYLSNALQLSMPADERMVVFEALGDADERIGDLPQALTAYKEAAKGIEDPEARARLHRKTASALMDRGEIAAASMEIEAGFKDLEELVDAERGWLNLLRCRVAQFASWEEARECGQVALQIFRTFDVLPGEGKALLELGWIELHSPDGDRSLAEQSFATALGLSRSLEDVKFNADVRIFLAHMYAYHLAQVDRAIEHLTKIESPPGATVDPQILTALLVEKAKVNLYLRADYSAAESQLNEAIAQAKRIHDPGTVLKARYHLALVSYFQGRIAEARRDSERAATDAGAMGDLSLQLRLLWTAAQCCLLAGDIEGFRHVAAAFRDPKLSQAAEGKGFEALPVPAKIIRGIDCLLKGDREGSLAAFSEALEIAGKLAAVHEAPSQSYAFYGPFYYGIVLRVIGREGEAQECIGRTAGILRKFGLKAELSRLPDLERRLTEVIQRALKTS